MSKITYNKLIRDRIPEIIDKAGKKYQITALPQIGFIKALKQKLVEEAQEFSQAQNQEEMINELADVLELVETNAVANGLDMATIRHAKIEKKRNRGGFKKKLLLEWVKE